MMIHENNCTIRASITPPPLSKNFFRRSEVTTYLEACYGYPIATATLAKYATIGGGPIYRKIGHSQNGRVIYRREDLDQWITEKMTNLRKNTAEI